MLFKTRLTSLNAVYANSSFVRFSPNSKFVLASTQDSTIRLWNYHTSRCMKTYTGHTNRTYCLFACFSTTNGNYVVSGSEDGKIYIWDLQTREVMQVLEGHRGPSVHVIQCSYNFLSVYRCGVVCSGTSLRTPSLGLRVKILSDPPNTRHHSVRIDGEGSHDSFMG